MDKKLHPNQEKLLELLRSSIDEPLSIDALREKLKISSKSVVFHHIKQLENKGYLKRNPNNPRDYQLLDTPEKSIVYINQYGLAECGSEGSILDGNPIDRIPIASKIIKFPSSDAFIVEAKGDSMEPMIQSGDLVIARKTNYAENGDIVVCVNDSMAIIKKLTRQKDNIILHSLNVKHHPFVASEDFRIEGVVKNVIHYN